jgi:hypothetical protein
MRLGRCAQGRLPSLDETGYVIASAAGYWEKGPAPRFSVAEFLAGRCFRKPLVLRGRRSLRRPQSLTVDHD